MLNRRDVLRMGGALGAAAFTPRPFKTTEHIAAASAAVADRTPEEVAQDEFYWREIQEAFTLDRTLTNLNNGNTCPAPRVVHEAVKRYMDMANMLPVQYNGMIGRNIDTVRRRMAAEFGCDPSELAQAEQQDDAGHAGQSLPVTFTILLKVTVTGMTAPTPYVPSAAVDDTFATVGAVASITMF